jgi:hypothetical protein
MARTRYAAEDNKIRRRGSALPKAPLRGASRIKGAMKHAVAKCQAEFLSCWPALAHSKKTKIRKHQSDITRSVCENHKEISFALEDHIILSYAPLVPSSLVTTLRVVTHVPTFCVAYSQKRSAFLGRRRRGASRQWVPTQSVGTRIYFLPIPYLFHLLSPPAKSGHRLLYRKAGNP